MRISGISGCIALFVFMLIQAACSRLMEIPLPPHNPKIVMVCIGGNDGPLNVQVSRSADADGFTSTPDVYYLHDAVVELYEEGRRVEMLTYREKTYPKRPWAFSADSLTIPWFESRHILQPGLCYELRARHPDYEPVSASACVPAAGPQTSNIRWEQHAAVDDLGFWVDHFYVTLQDSSTIPEFYYAAIETKHILLNWPVQNEIVRFFSPEVRSISPAVEVYPVVPGLFKVNPGASGVVLRFELSEIQRQHLGYKLHLRRCSPEYAEYLQKIQLQFEYREQQAYSPFFSVYTPVVLPDNVSGGFGIFATYNARIDSIR